MTTRTRMKNPCISSGTGKRPLLRSSHGGSRAMEIDLSKEDDGGKLPPAIRPKANSSPTSPARPAICFVQRRTRRIGQPQFRHRAPPDAAFRAAGRTGHGRRISFGTAHHGRGRPGRLSERRQVHAAHGHFQGAAESRAVSVHHAASADRHCRISPTGSGSRSATCRD